MFLVGRHSHFWAGLSALIGAVLIAISVNADWFIWQLTIGEINTPYRAKIISPTVNTKINEALEEKRYDIVMVYSPNGECSRARGITVTYNEADKLMTVWITLGIQIAMGVSALIFLLALANVLRKLSKASFLIILFELCFCIASVVVLAFLGSHPIGVFYDILKLACDFSLNIQAKLLRVNSWAVSELILGCVFSLIAMVLLAREGWSLFSNRLFGAKHE